MNAPSLQPAHRSVAEQLDEARAAVRLHAGDVGARHRLWQLLAVQGDWKRAWEQAGVTLQLLGDAPSSVATHRAAIEAEIEREAVFAGTRTPALDADAPGWVQAFVGALACDARGEADAAQALRQQGRAEAPASAGVLTDERDAQIPFSWLCDGDDRLGPICELIVDGRYLWLPLARIASWRQSRPQGLTDLLWSPVVLALRDGGTLAGLMPARYPLPAGDPGDCDESIRLCRRTSWVAHGGDHHTGVGQRMLLTDADEHGMLDVRSIQFATEEG